MNLASKISMFATIIAVLSSVAYVSYTYGCFETDTGVNTKNIDIIKNKVGIVKEDVEKVKTDIKTIQKDLQFLTKNSITKRGGHYGKKKSKQNKEKMVDSRKGLLNCSSDGWSDIFNNRTVWNVGDDN